MSVASKIQCALVNAMRLMFSVFLAVCLVTTAAQGMTHDQYIARLNQIDTELNAARVTHDKLLRYAAGDQATIEEIETQYNQKKNRLQREKSALITQWGNAAIKGQPLPPRIKPGPNEGSTIRSCTRPDCVNAPPANIRPPCHPGMACTR